MIKTSSIQVPVCRKCAKQGKIVGTFFVGGIALGAVIGLLTSGIPGGLVGGFLGAIAGALVSRMVTKMTEPASIHRDGSISFRNPKYEALFRAAN